ncbi:DNA repair protein XRCC3 isoform X2 [Thunnus maccoyii]|uniref:DNA repair protein XRCC3 isoform X2 n=1 Tax=Thunnus maccoyii TaxID=8240 RepID=UPI001C4B3E7E|nr:DNA repair protein XRCC3 isoform X2 [Thunnus maccoyii]
MEGWAQVSERTTAGLGQVSERTTAGLGQVSERTTAGLGQVSERTTAGLGQVSERTTAGLAQVSECTTAGLGSGAVYICTEDRFPSRRLQQLIGQQVYLRSDVPPAEISRLRFSDHVYIEHTADLVSLHTCLSRRVPLLLARGLVRLVVVDSVASLFRSEFQAADWLERTRHLLTFSSCLHHLSHEFNTPVLCINQVTGVFSGSVGSLGPVSASVSPALGLAWANQVLVRLMMHRLQGTVSRADQRSALRRLEVVFAPHLAQGGRDAAVWTEGVRGLAETPPFDAPL